MLQSLRVSLSPTRLRSSLLVINVSNVREQLNAKFCWNCALFRSSSPQSPSIPQVRWISRDVGGSRHQLQNQNTSWKERKKDSPQEILTKVLESRQQQLETESQPVLQTKGNTTSGKGKGRGRPKKSAAKSSENSAKNPGQSKDVDDAVKPSVKAKVGKTTSSKLVSSKVTKKRTLAKRKYDLDKKIVENLSRTFVYTPPTDDNLYHYDSVISEPQDPSFMSNEFSAVKQWTDSDFAQIDNIDTWTPSLAEISEIPQSAEEQPRKKKKKKPKKKTAERPSSFIKRPNMGLMQELEGLLRDNQMAPKMQKHLEVLIHDLRLRLGLVHQEGKKNGKVLRAQTQPGVQFWKPKELNDMDEIKAASQVVRVLNEQASRSKAQEMHAAEHVERLQKTYNEEVFAYVEACVHCGMLTKAQWLLVPKLGRKSKRKQRGHQKIVDVNIYNTLMRVWAKQGNLHMVQKLFVGMEENEVKPDLLSYALTLQCVARQTVCPDQLLDNIFLDIKKHSYDVRDILRSCELSEEEWQLTEKCLKMRDPYYEAYKPECRLPYESELMLPLNEEPTVPINNPNAGALYNSEISARIDKQIAMETNTSVTVESVIRKPVVTKQINKARKILGEHRDAWKEALSKSFERNLASLVTLGENASYAMDLVPYLKILPKEVYINALMEEVEYLAREAATFAPSLSYLQRKLAMRLFQEYVVARRNKSGYTVKMRELFEDFVNQFNEEHLRKKNYREMWEDIVNQETYGLTLNSKITMWPRKVIQELGKHLYNTILYDVKVNSQAFFSSKAGHWIPAFYVHLEQLNDNMKPEKVIKPHPTLSRLYDSAHVEEMIFPSSAMPSLVPPLPWTTVTHGADLFASTELIKNSHRSEQQVEALSSLPRCQSFPVLDALNAVSATPWKINKPVLDLVLDIFRDGGNADLDIPPPASILPPLPKVTSDMTAEEKLETMEKRKTQKKREQEMHGIWITELYRFSIADKFRDEIFWFPHNVDFRGRSYAVPPYFNHLGGDLARSLINFAIGKPLGPQGLNWLKIHCINLTGFKKRSPNAERLAYANEIMPKILDSADKPLTGEKWWQTSDEPWQTLSCCMEITRASRSLDADRYICHFPVHQDGSCNGLQHYAALGRDQAGAESVNLYPFEAPKDVYSDVVELVEQERKKDAFNGVEIARILEGFVKRKVIKQTIMTTVYGVTRYGARLQIQGQLEDIKEFPAEMTFQGAQYLVHLTFKCLQEMFTSTKEIQDWFTVSAELLAGVINQSVSWETPLGFPVIQPYRRPAHEKLKTFSTPGGKVTKYTHYSRPNLMRQKNAYPPNFIHSLDATHMMLTAVNCLRAGVSFVSVHDCFWTHACDVPVMNKICRDQFVALHKHPILEDLAKYMQEKYCADIGKTPVADPITLNFVKYVLGRIPDRGNFDLEKVLESTYFFS